MMKFTRSHLKKHSFLTQHTPICCGSWITSFPAVWSH